MDWAKAAGFITGENPVVGVAKGLPRQRIVRQHHAALPYGEVPDFVQRLRGSDAGEIVRLAFEFLILTAARTGEVISACWTEMDIPGHVWIVPAERMKARREHRVPLSDCAVEILERAKILAGGSEFVFSGRTVEKPISNMAFLMLLRRMGENVTAHGFRSAFRDWAAETTNFPRDVCEMALAHVIADKTEAAYRRGDLIEKRRQLMCRWAAHVCPTGSKIVRLSA
jgi:integrase